LLSEPKHAAFTLKKGKISVVLDGHFNKILCYDNKTKWLSYKIEENQLKTK
jgi:hypothetical protein